MYQQTSRIIWLRLQENYNLGVRFIFKINQGLNKIYTGMVKQQQGKTFWSRPNESPGTNPMKNLNLELNKAVHTWSRINLTEHGRSLGCFSRMNDKKKKTGVSRCASLWCFGKAFRQAGFRLPQFNIGSECDAGRSVWTTAAFWCTSKQPKQGHLPGQANNPTRLRSVCCVEEATPWSGPAAWNMRQGLHSTHSTLERVSPLLTFISQESGKKKKKSFFPWILMETLCQWCSVWDQKETNVMQWHVYIICIKNKIR